MDADTAADCSERQQDELDGLRAIYLATELEVVAIEENGEIEFGITYTPPSPVQGIQFHARLPRFYPLHPPVYTFSKAPSASASASSTFNTESILDKLKEISAEETGCEHLMLAIQAVTDLLVESKPNVHEKEETERREESARRPHELSPSSNLLLSQVSCSNLSQVCLFIDHMNDHLAYMKKVTSWCKELGLTGVVLYRMRTKHINAVSGGSSVTPKGRAEDIYVLLEGEAGDTKDFLTRLRTFKMTSQDRREKKSKVLWDNISSNGGGRRADGPGGMVDALGAAADGGGADGWGADGTGGSGGGGAAARAGGAKGASVGTAAADEEGAAASAVKTGVKGSTSSTTNQQRSFSSFESRLYQSRAELEQLWATTGLGAVVPITETVPHA